MERSNPVLAGVVGTASIPCTEAASALHPRQLSSVRIVVPLANQFLKGNYRLGNATKDQSFAIACSYVG